MSLVLKIEQIEEKDFARIFVLSDIHGYHSLFDKALKTINLHPDDLLIIAGDSCDRGPETALVYEKITAMKDTFPIIHLLGNHEWMFYNYLHEQIGYELWMMNGGEHTLNSYQKHLTLLDEHLDYVRQMPVFLETDRHIITHAGHNPEIPFEMENPDKALWYSKEELSRYQYEKTLVTGHHITQSGEIEFCENNRILLDCGSYLFHRLGILELKTYKTYYID